jgi:hypothetical protein
MDFSSPSRARYNAGMAQQQTAAESLAALLAQSGTDYLCLSTLPDSVVRVRFLGRFQDRPVAWEATIYTLQRYHEEQGAHSTAAARIPSGRPFIDIAPSTDGSIQLTVGLNLEVIDAPAIKKTIIMVRNYKRLRVGRMEWAPPVADD